MEFPCACLVFTLNRNILARKQDISVLLSSPERVNTISKVNVKKQYVNLHILIFFPALSRSKIKHLRLHFINVLLVSFKSFSGKPKY
jgi:hypothetical protein